LRDAAAQVVSHVGETMLQTPLSVALTGDERIYSGLARSKHYRWFTDLSTRLIYPADDRDEQSRLIVADLHASYTRNLARAGTIVDALLAVSPEFAGLWSEHPVPGPYCGPVRFQHREVGTLLLHCQRLIDPDQSQQLVVYTATPGTEDYEKFELLSVIGAMGSPLT
jgi:hypothetical protein